MIATAAIAPLVQTVERAAFETCAAVLRGEARIDDARAMRRLGFIAQASDDEGDWAAKAHGDVVVRIGTSAGQAGCRVRFDGPGAVAVYERLLPAIQSRGYTFVQGKRAPAEPQFVMDTLIGGGGPIAIVSMFRVNDPGATMFAMTLYPLSRD